MKFTGLNLLIIMATTLFLSSCSSEETKNKIVTEINENWEFKQVGKKKWMPASIPGSVHLNLLENKQIKAPFFRMNEKNSH